VLLVTGIRGPVEVEVFGATRSGGRGSGRCRPRASTPEPPSLGQAGCANIDELHGCGGWWMSEKE